MAFGYRSLRDQAEEDGARKRIVAEEDLYSNAAGTKVYTADEDGFLPVEAAFLIARKGREVPPDRVELVEAHFAPKPKPATRSRKKKKENAT